MQLSPSVLHAYYSWLKKIYLNLHLVFSQSSPWMSWGLGVLPLGQKPRGRETSTWFWTVQNQFCTSRSKVWTGRICPPCQQAVDWFSSNKTLNIPPTIRFDTEFTINGGKKMIVFHSLHVHVFKTMFKILTTEMCFFFFRIKVINSCKIYMAWKLNKHFVYISLP